MYECKCVSMCVCVCVCVCVHSACMWYIFVGGMHTSIHEDIADENTQSISIAYTPCSPYLKD